jgi:hypothetical protein
VTRAAAPVASSLATLCSLEGRVRVWMRVRVRLRLRVRVWVRVRVRVRVQRHSES